VEGINTWVVRFWSTGSHVAGELVFGFQPLVLKCIDGPAFGLDVSLLQDVLDLLRNAERPPQRRTLPWRVDLVGVVRRGTSVREQAAVLVHKLCDRLRQSTADTIGVNIDARGERSLKLLLQVLGSIINAFIDAECVEYPLASIRATAEADHVTPGNPGKLRGNRSDRSGGAGDRNAIPWHQRAAFPHPEIC